MQNGYRIHSHTWKQHPTGRIDKSDIEIDSVNTPRGGTHTNRNQHGPGIFTLRLHGWGRRRSLPFKRSRQDSSLQHTVSNNKNLPKRQTKSSRFVVVWQSSYNYPSV